MNRSQFLKTLFGCVAAAAVPFKAKRRLIVTPLPVDWKRAKAAVTLEFYPSRYKAGEVLRLRESLLAQKRRWEERQRLLHPVKRSA